MRLVRTSLMRTWLRGQNLLLVVFLLLPAVSLLPLLTGFPYPSSAARYSDFTVSHYPNALYLQGMISKGIIPLWSPLILSGYPFFASPLSGLWYPPGWLALMLPLPFGLNLMVLLHVLSAGIGMYLLARKQGLAPLPSALAGLTFSGMPKIAAHLGAGHITLIFAVSWMPWLLLAAVSRKRAASLEAIVLAFIALADPRWLPYAAGLWLWYRIFILDGGKISPYQIGRISVPLLNGLLLAAPLLVPLWEYAGLSSRAAMTASDVFEYSLPWERLLGLFFPSPGGFHEWMIYPGSVVIVLALSAPLIVREHGYARKVLSWGLLTLLCLLWALGEYVPGLTRLAGLPVINWLRVPSRSLFIAGMGLNMLAAYGLQAALQGVEERALYRVRLLIFAALAIAGGVGLGVQVLSGRVLLPFMWGWSGITAASLMLLVWTRARPTSNWWGGGMVILAAIDLLLMGRTLVAVRPTADVLSEGALTAQYLARLRAADGAGAFRTYSPSYSLPQHTAALYGLELADGVEPLQWKPYVAYMGTAAGVPATDYSVTLPAYANGRPENANQAYLPDAESIGWLNVRYVVSEFDLHGKGLQWVETFGTTRIYLNRFARPRAWVQSKAGSDLGEIQPVIDLRIEPNNVEVRAQGEGMLVLAELAYPGWEARLDGKSVPLLKTQGTLRAVDLPPGEHLVSFVFQPVSLSYGLSLFLVGLALLIGQALQEHRLQR